MHCIPKTIPLLLALALAAVAPAQVTTIQQDFKGTSAAGWSFGNNGGVFTPALTAASGIDTTGNGWLRLTDANGAGNEATFARYNTAFNAANATLAVQFNFASYGGSGADGITFFLADASKPLSVGAYGGSLGYAQKTGINGMNGGYIGLGIDEYGNYSAAAEGRVGGIGTGLTPDSIAIRGPGQGTTGYDYLGGTGTLSTALDFPGAATPRPTGTDSRAIQIVITATNQLTVYLKAGDTGQFVPLYTIDLSGYARPDQLVMGFTGSTGGATNIHEIQNVTLTSVAANLWANSANDSRWATATDWHGSAVPATGADVLLDNTYVSTAQTIDVGAGLTRSVRSLQIDAPFAYTLNNGTLEFNNNGVLGPSGILVSSAHGSASQTINSNLIADNAMEIRNGSAGTLNLGGTLATNGNTVTVDGSGRTAMSGVISGTGSVTKNDQSTLVLSGNNTFTGNLNLNAGEVQLGAGDRLADAVTTNFNGGTLNLGGFSERVGNITLSDDSTLNFGPTGGANYFLFTNLTGTPSGVLTIKNWEQATDILASSGTVSQAVLDSLYFVGFGSGATQGAAQTVGTYGAGWQPLTPTTAGWYTWDSGAGSSRWSSGTNWDSSSVPPSYAKVAFGTGNQNAVDLRADRIVNAMRFDAGAPVFTIGTAADGHTLTFAGTAAGSSAIAFIQQRGTNNQTIATQTVNLANNTVVDMIGSGNLTIGSALTGTGNLAKENTGGKLILSGNSAAYTGNIFVDSGILQITNSNALGSADTGTTSVADGAALEISGGTVASGEDIAFQGSGVANGGAIRSLNGTNTLSGTLSLTGAGRIAVDAGTLTLTNNITSSNNADLTLAVAAAPAALTISGTISTGGGGVTKEGAGTVTFSGTNSYTGATNINAGTLALGANNALSDSTAVTVASGATLNLANYSDTVGSIAGAGSVTLGSGTLTAGAANGVTTFSGVISGTGGLTKTGTGTLTLSGNNTYTGGTTVAGGTLALGASERLANNAAVTVASGAALTLNNFTETIGALSGSGVVTLGSGTLTVGSGNASSTFAGSFAGGDTGTFAKTGTGTLTFGTGMNLANGTLSVAGGTLNLGGFTSTFSALSVTANSIIDFGTGGASVLNILNSLTVSSGVTLTIADWTNTVDYFYAQYGDPGPTVRGRIAFTGYTGVVPQWQSFDHEITPVPEPSVYGAVLVLGALLTGLWCRRRRTC